MSNMDPPNTRALGATFNGGLAPPGARIPRSCSTVPPPAVLRPDLVRQGRLEHQRVATGSRLARTGALASLILAAIADTVSPGESRMSAPSILIVESVCTRYWPASTVE